MAAERVSLERIPEPEPMDSPAQASACAEADFAESNQCCDRVSDRHWLVSGCLARR